MVRLPSAPPTTPATTATASASATDVVEVPGYCDYFGGTFIWRDAHATAPKPHYVLVAARYLQRDGQWFLRLPHWERAASASVAPADASGSTTGDSPRLSGSAVR